MPRRLALFLSLVFSTLAPTAAVAASPPQHFIHQAPHVEFQRGTHAPSSINRTTSLVCPNNDCPTSGAHLKDGGGPIVTAPKVYVARFTSADGGLTPSTGFVQGAFQNAEPNVAGAIAASVSSRYSSWWSEYSRPALGQIISPGSYAGSITLTSPLATSSKIDDNTIGDTLAAAVTAKTLPSFDTNTIFVLYFRSGQTITAGGMDSKTGFCGYHTALLYPGKSLNYVVMPNESTNPGCSFTSATSSAFDNMTPVLSHELTETVTDPSMPIAWYDTPNNAEIGDLCESSGGTIAGLVRATSGVSYSLQFEYSNMANACIATKTPATLAATATAGNTTSVAATLTNGTSPISGATLSLLSGSTRIATAITNPSGQASFTIASTPTSSLSVFYAGSGSVAGATAATTQPLTPATLLITSPATMLANTPTAITASLSPPDPGHVVSLTGFSGTKTATTDASGVAHFSVSPAMGSFHITASTPATATLSSATASATLTSIDGFNGYRAASLAPTSTMIKFTLNSHLGQLPAATAAALASAGKVGLTIAGPHSTSTETCAYNAAQNVFKCPIALEAGTTTVTPKLLIASTWTTPVVTGPSVVAVITK